MQENPFSKIQMVDDKANRFLPPSNMSWINGANLNDDTYKESGLYCIGSGSSNSPGNWGILTVLKPRNDAVIQYYALNNIMYHRDYTGGSWQSWKTFADMSDKGSVSVTADGVKKYNELLNELFALVDMSKISSTSYMILSSTNYIYNYVTRSGVYITFSETDPTINGYSVGFMILASSVSNCDFVSYTTSTAGTTSKTSSANSVAPNGRKITLYY